VRLALAGSVCATLNDQGDMPPGAAGPKMGPELVPTYANDGHLRATDAQ
jgi:hypothetical protein